MTGISAEAEKIKQTLTPEILDTTSIVEKREAWEAAARAVPLLGGITIEEYNFNGVRCVMHTGSDVQDSDQLILYIHGGGLVEGSTETAREWCSRLAQAALYPVLAVDYSLAPEHPFPIAINEVVSVCESVLEDSRFSLMGIGADSTGAVLALSALIKLRDKKRCLPSSCFFLSPSLDLSFSGNSTTENLKNDSLVSLNVLEHYAQLYCANANVASPEISPLFADLHGLPPILIHVDESELLLDDAVRLQEKVHEVAGDVELVTTRGLWHVWPTWGDFPESRLATKQIAEHIRLNRLVTGSAY